MEDYLKTYRDYLTGMFDRILDTQRDAIAAAAARMADRIASRASIYAYGPGHAGIFAEELFYRAGGLAVVNPLFPAGTLLSVRPVTLCSDIECIPGYASAILDASPAKRGDLLLIHSMAGRNPAVVEMARRAKEKGIDCIALVNLAHAARVTSKDPSGEMLHQVADLVIDTCGGFGDACVAMEGVPGAVAPASTAACAFLANALTLETCRLLLARGIEPPVLVSANAEGGRAYNDRVFGQYQEQIHYMN